jgi:UPF0755 protein
VSSQSSFVRKTFSLLAVLILVAVLAVATIVGYQYLGPYRIQGDIFVDIERGTSTRAIAAQLAGGGVIRSSYAFLAMRALRPGAHLQAGEYRFTGETTPWQVFDKIRRGDVYYEQLTIPEGSNIFDIANLLRNAGLPRTKDFLQQAQSAALVADLDPQAPSLEGFLFPSSYRVNHKTTGAQICRMMVAEFRHEWKELAPAIASGPEVHRLVTLASLVEKETAVPGERPLVSAVFMNRLRTGMPLQCDPTTVYAALKENRYGGVIHKSDLTSTNPYNTYAHTGLPPGPIANPGVASLRAALSPAESDVLYFVAKPDGSGTHHFSSTLQAHEKAVLEFRKETQP